MTNTSGGEKLNYCKLLLDKSLQAEYKRIFKTDGFNWSKGQICGAHWSSGGRKSPQDLPDIPLPIEQYELLKVKYEKAKKIYTAAKRPTDKQVQSYKNAKKKLSAGLRLSQTSPLKVRKPGLRSTPIKRKKPSFKEVGFIDFK